MALWSWELHRTSDDEFLLYSKVEIQGSEIEMRAYSLSQALSNVYKSSVYVVLIVHLTINVVND